MDKASVLYTTQLAGYSSSVDRRIPFTVPLRYQKLRVNSLDYGVVGVAAVDSESGKKVTIHRYTLQKDMRWLKQTWKLLQLRKNYNHRHIVKLLYCYTVDEDFESFSSFYLVTESMDSCLQYISHTVRLAETHRVLSQVLHQLLSALSYLHTCGVVLRTMNTGNVLMNFTQNYDTVVDLKLIANPLISQVAGYISPECLLNKFCSDPKTDSWLVGCVFGELLMRKNLFSFYAESVSLFEQILSFCKKPPEMFMKKVGKKFQEVVDDFDDEDFGCVEESFPENCFPCADEDYPEVWNEETGMDLLSRLLSVDSSERISVEDALDHPYISMWNEEKPEHRGNFVFSAEEIDSLYLTYGEWREMFFKEVKTIEMKHPLLVHSLQDVCVHEISHQLHSIDGADLLCLPTSMKLRLKNYMSHT